MGMLVDSHHAYAGALLNTGVECLLYGIRWNTDKRFLVSHSLASEHGECVRMMMPTKHYTPW